MTTTSCADGFCGADDCARCRPGSTSDSGDVDEGASEARFCGPDDRDCDTYRSFDADFGGLEVL